MRSVIIVFARAPVAGRVKTRLIPPLTPAAAAALHEAFVRDTVECLESLSPPYSIELHTDLATESWRDLDVPRRPQYEGDLGLKMLKALADALERGHERAIILGSDSPSVPPGHVEAILRCDADVALGPADDGGYYAIAARRVHERMFDGVRWSTPHALEDTLRACGECNLTTAQGPPWFDVDDVLGLERLRASASPPRHTARVLATLRKLAPDHAP